MAGGPVVRVRGLVKEYTPGRPPALRGVDLDVEKGAFVAIMGPSGSGKSTLLHLLGGLDTPTAGEIELAGHCLSSLSDRALTELRRETIGFVFQAYNLVPVLSVADNVSLPRVIANAAPQSYRERLDYCFELVGLADRRDEFPAQLSGGEQQRVAIARALLPEPTVLLADEPTGNLDTLTGGEVLGLLRETVEEEGTTIVMVTHDPRAAAAADAVVLLVDGVVAGNMELAGAGDLNARAAQILEWLVTAQSDDTRADQRPRAPRARLARPKVR